MLHVVTGHDGQEPKTLPGKEPTFKTRQPRKGMLAAVGKSLEQICGVVSHFRVKIMPWVPPEQGAAIDIRVKA